MGRCIPTLADAGGYLHLAGRGRADHPGRFGSDDLADALGSSDTGGDVLGIDRVASQRARKAEDLGQSDPLWAGSASRLWAVGGGAFLSGNEFC